MNPFYLGQLVWRHRQTKGESYQSLAALTGCSMTWLRQLEHGWLEEPEPHLLGRVADALNIDRAAIDRLNGGSVLDDPRAERVYFHSHHYVDQPQLDEIDKAFRVIQTEGHEDGEAMAVGAPR
jgi:transcriptional regulator with XRE-family HTH domain